MLESPPQVILGNGAKYPTSFRGTDKPPHIFDISDRSKDSKIKVQLPDFVRSVVHIPERILDLLEIANYVFLADRLTSRGQKYDLEYHSWSRSFEFYIKVRDRDFWEMDRIKNKLSTALEFMTGDRSYVFHFQSGHSTHPTSLFDKEEFKISPSDKTSVILFSGGLDSLSGVIEHLEETHNKICLVSHRSGQPGTAKTQDRLFGALKEKYPDRLIYYKFQCNLRRPTKSKEETQRSRAFLYTSIAYALANSMSVNEFYVYENGITTLNFAKRPDMINARASRTTHPQTLTTLGELFSEIEGSRISIKTPYIWKTKTEIFENFKKHKQESLISSSVSCSKTRESHGEATHCGKCSQCIDRRISAYASKLDDFDDSGIYSFDFINQTIEDGLAKTMILDYIRQAKDFDSLNINSFYEKYLDELSDIVDFIEEGEQEDVAIGKIWELCHRHGYQVMESLKRIREIYDDVRRLPVENSLLAIISDRRYLRKPIEHLVGQIIQRLKHSVPIAFQRNLPTNENDFNDKISAILNSDRERFDREHPVISFALCHTIPDHSYKGYQLLIESKYIRGATSPSKVSEGVSADLIKYPEDSYILFIIYDPHRAIKEDEKFSGDIEKKRKNLCKICIVR